ncbi:MAG: glycosyltransferase family 2 protein [Candidatus Methylomirabilia bacterium]
MKITLLVCTLNEIEGMKIVIPRIDRSWVDEILVVDGGSTDGTVEWARENGYRVYVQRRRGLRNAYIEALDQIAGDVFIPFSPDGNSVPEVIPLLAAKIRGGCAHVMATRYGQGAKSDDDDLLTGFGNWAFPAMVNLAFGTRFTDVLGMYRAIRVDVFKALKMHLDETYHLEDAITRCTMGCEPLLSMRLAKYRLPCAEVPGDEPKRIAGIRKLQVFRWGCGHLIQLLKERFSRRDPEVVAALVRLVFTRDAR